jgi:signal transduction histidine kinase
VVIRKEPLSLLTVGQEAAGAARSSVEKKGLAILFHSSGDDRVVADREKMSQVFSNLFSNAVKYTENGSIAVSINRERESVLCSVTDTGRGVHPEFLEKIFDRYFQAPGASKGAGLGLAIAKGWVEAHGGRIWAESEGEGKGTTVTFTLPVQEEAS